MNRVPVDDSMRERRPGVSVVIPSFNRATVVDAAIGSALNQLDADVEVIVVDDGSTDDTSERIVHALADGRLRYVRQANRGRSEARNHGARLAYGEWLLFLDSDDVLLPHAVAAHRSVIDATADLGMTVGGYQLVSESLNRCHGIRRPWEEGGSLSLSGWLANCYGMPGSVMIRRDWFERAGGFAASCETAEDWALYLKLAAMECPMAWVRQSVCLYRQHPDNSTLDLHRHLHGACMALESVAGASPEGEPQPEAVKRAAGWLYATFAGRALAAGATADAEAWLAEAIRLDLRLADEQSEAVLENIFLRWGDASPYARDSERDLRAVCSRALVLRGGAFRRARARVAMAEFFAARSRGERGLGHILVEGLRRNPRWLANRGVLSYIVRDAWRRAS